MERNDLLKTSIIFEILFRIKEYGFKTSFQHNEQKEKDIVKLNIFR